jgi:NAD(P)H-flavin reductase
VQTRRGLTAKLRARAALEGSASFSAFVSGPHGISEPVSQHDTVLTVASGFGIADVIPYLKQLLHGYNTSTSRIRRVHFVWQVQTLGKSILLPEKNGAKVGRYCNCGLAVAKQSFD